MSIFNNMQVEESRFNPTPADIGLQLLPQEAVVHVSSVPEYGWDRLDVYYTLGTQDGMYQAIAFIGPVKLYWHGELKSTTKIEFADISGEYGDAGKGVELTLSDGCIAFIKASTFGLASFEGCFNTDQSV